jgi:hypothetical protein
MQWSGRALRSPSARSWMGKNTRPYNPSPRRISRWVATNTWIPQPNRANDLSYRCQGEGSCMHGHLDHKSASHDEYVLQAFIGPVQDPMRGQSIPIRSGRPLSPFEWFRTRNTDYLSNRIRQQYAFASQAHLHGYDPKEAIIELSPREGEYSLRPNDILDVIAREGSSIALVLFSGIQYYTGQWFPMESITRAAKEQVSICLAMSPPWLHVVRKQGCICGWDLAHAIGNVPLSLHDWDADFAVWCTYKYLNSGPGGIGGLYIHEKWDDKKTQYVQSNKPDLGVM